MSQKDYKTILGFTDEWLTLGLVTQKSLVQSGTFYDAGIDTSIEHYRYGAFRQYLKDHLPLTAAMAEALYALGAADDDAAMGGAMMADVVALPECPSSVITQAMKSDRKHLIQAAQRKQLLLDLQTETLTPELFRRCLAWQDSVIERILLERMELSTQQAQALAEHGTTLLIRNIAKNRLRQRRHRQETDR